MKSYTQHIDDLLVKHLTGEATEAETLQVQQWLMQSEANQHYFDHFKLIWEESIRLASVTEVNEQAAWERFQHRVQHKATITSRPKVRTMQLWWMRAAAAVAIVAGIASITYFLFNNNPGKVVRLVTIQATGTVKTDTLPDGSQVVLNKHSQLSYPNLFTGNERVIQLNGEAFFKVTPDKKKPFIIHTNDVTITVTGTSFNVRSRGDSTEIIVETGKVSVDIGRQAVALQAGEKAIAAQKAATLQKQRTADQLHNYYRSKQFECDHTPLWKLVEKLNEAYDVHIVIENTSKRNEPLTSTFDNQPLDKILDLISGTLDVSVTREGEHIILR